jgi:hypothetical protein
MLNLSDKDLDRFSREAAQEHDPGDLMGPRSWEKLKIRLDKELGRVGSNPFRGVRGIRRLSIYYAPLILILLGVSYYFVKSSKNNSPVGSSRSPLTSKMASSGSPPVRAAKTIDSGKTADPSSTKISSTKIPSHNYTSTPDKHPADQPANQPNKQPAVRSNSQPVSPPNGQQATATTLNITRSPQVQYYAGYRHSTGHIPVKGSDLSHLKGVSASAATTGQATDGFTAEKAIKGKARRADDRNAGTIGEENGRAAKAGGSTNRRQSGSKAAPSEDQEAAGEKVSSGHSQAKPSHSTDQAVDLAAAIIARPHSLAGRPAVDDSALRAFTAKAPPIHLTRTRNSSLHINKSLQLGLSVAPDFASVNSLAGDKPGISIGLTADYQFVNRWYVSTGLLYSRKNYAASAQDYHVPKDYYLMNNIQDVQFVKGTIDMLEIPLNLRYDFSVTGNTIFFASAGVSSYLATSENCNYYFNFFGRDVYREFKYPSHENYLLGAINLSLGAEANISNSFSMLIAPYMKLHTTGVGFGQIQMSSVGINFAFKFAPVLSRKRH